MGKRLRTRVMGKRGFEEYDGKARTRVKGDWGKRRFERARLRTRMMKESEADGIVGWLRLSMKGDGEVGL